MYNLNYDKQKLNKGFFGLPFLIFTASLWIIHGFTIKLAAQVQTQAWGNVSGIRVDGELMKFETSLRVVKKNWLDFNQTAKEEQNPIFKRSGQKAEITSSIDNLKFFETVKDSGKGRAKISYSITTDSNVTMQGTYFCIELPHEDFSNPEIDYVDQQMNLDDTSIVKDKLFDFRSFLQLPVTAKGIKIKSKKRNLEITADRTTKILVQNGSPFIGDGNRVIYFTIIPGSASTGQKYDVSYTIKISGEVDDTPVVLKLDASDPGREFDGIGGNFRIQNPKADSSVIDYCLKNLNVTWGRVELPWFNWQREESIDPIQEANSGNVDPRVVSSMKMAQKLSRMNIPFIISVWYPPQWAVIGKISFRRHQPGEPWGYPLNPMKMRGIERSIASYLIYLKEHYGAVPALFSFNESDLGINIRQTGKEHDELIKELGSYFASKGITTKLLLGDNSDATTYGFVEDALDDPATHQYIGAVSFHSWRGCDNGTLSIWADIAKQLNVPLIVAEGSNDAAAWSYPDVFLEPSYALNEIDTYLRIYSICQAKSILQWQLTSDYSVLTGEGIYEGKGHLKPTQRFWNLKQLGLTPKGSFYLSLSCNRPDISSVAFGDIKNGIYSVHIVNNAADREVKLTGLPDTIKYLNIYVTDQDRGMEQIKRISIRNGEAEFKLDSACFTTLINN